jgi:hypothetical protein
MSELAISPSIAELAVGVPRPMAAFGGTPPYTFTLVGAGNFNASTLIYTAPSVQPEPNAQPILRVVDDVGDEAEAEIFICTPLQLLGRIIQREMGLSDGRVYLWDQKINAPTDKGLFIAISALNPKAYANINKFNYVTNRQEQSSNWATGVDIDIISRGPEARDRKEEVVMALKSQYSLQQQELNSFSIASLPTAIRNLSEIDGAAIPYRFNFSVNLLYNVRKIQPAEYFDTFETPELLVDP